MLADTAQSVHIRWFEYLKDFFPVEMLILSKPNGSHGHHNPKKRSVIAEVTLSLQNVTKCHLLTLVSFLRVLFLMNLIVDRTKKHFVRNVQTHFIGTEFYRCLPYAQIFAFDFMFQTSHSWVSPLSPLGRS